MPLYFHKYLIPEGELGIWKMEEDLDFFLSQMRLNEKEDEILESYRGKAKIEWLSSRYLLHRMSGREVRAPLIKDEYGKPYLEGSPYYISLSHSYEKAAVIAAPGVVGIDIQKIIPKIVSVAPRFMNEEEFDSLNDMQILQMHVYWGAKECLYKSYGKKSLDFRTNICIEPFEMKKNYGTIKGEVIKSNFRKKYNIHFQQLDNYVVVYSFEE